MNFCFIFALFFCPFPRGGSVFLPCVLVTSAHEPRGGARFFHFFWPNTGGRASSAKFFCETRGANGRQICCPPFLGGKGGFWVFPSCIWLQQGMQSRLRKRGRRRRRRRRRRRKRRSRRRRRRRRRRTKRKKKNNNNKKKKKKKKNK